jgi:stage V sporulation protein B
MAGTGRKGATKFEKKQYFTFILPLFAGQLLLNALLQLDITLLGKFAADAAGSVGLAVSRADALVASYRATQLFSFLPYQLLLSITFILFPLLAKAHREGKQRDVALFIVSGLRLALIVAGAIITVTAGIPGPLLRMVFTAEIAEPAVRSMGLLTLGFGSFAVFGILTTVLTSLQHERASAMVTGLAVSLVVVLSFVFVRGQPFGPGLLWRMAIATSCGLVLATCTAGYLVYRFTGAVINGLSLARVAIALAAAVVLGRFLGPHGFVRTVGTAIVLEIVYMMLLVMLREFKRADVDRLLSVVRRRPA